MAFALVPAGPAAAAAGAMLAVARPEDVPASVLYGDPVTDGSPYHRHVGNPDGSGLHAADNTALRVPVAPADISARLPYWGAALPTGGLLKFNSADWLNAPRDPSGLAVAQAPVGFVRVDTNRRTHAMGPCGGRVAGECGRPEGGGVFSVARHCAGLQLLCQPPEPMRPTEAAVSGKTAQRRGGASSAAATKAAAAAAAAAAASNRCWSCAAVAAHEDVLLAQHDCVAAGRVMARDAARTPCDRCPISSDCVATELQRAFVHVACAQYWLSVRQCWFFNPRTHTYVAAFEPESVHSVRDDVYVFVAAALGFRLRPEHARSEKTPRLAVEKAMACVRRDGTVDSVALDEAAALHLSLRSFVAFVSERLYMCGMRTDRSDHPMYEVIGDGTAAPWIDPTFPAAPLAPGRVYQASGRFECYEKLTKTGRSSTMFFFARGWMPCEMSAEDQRLMYDASTGPIHKGGARLCGIFQLNWAKVLSDKRAYWYMTHLYLNPTEPALPFAHPTLGARVRPTTSTAPPAFATLGVAATVLRASLAVFLSASAKGSTDTAGANTPGGKAARGQRTRAPSRKEVQHAVTSLNQAVKRAKRVRGQRVAKYMDDELGWESDEEGEEWAERSDDDDDKAPLPPLPEKRARAAASDEVGSFSDDASSASRSGVAVAAAKLKTGALREAATQAAAQARVRAAEEAAASSAALVQALKNATVRLPRIAPFWTNLVIIRWRQPREKQGTVTSALLPNQYPRTATTPLEELLAANAFHPREQQTVRLCNAWLDAGLFTVQTGALEPMDRAQLGGAVCADVRAPLARAVALPARVHRMHTLLWDAVAAERRRTDAVLAARFNFTGAAADASALAWVFQVGMRAGLPVDVLWYLVLLYAWYDCVPPLWLSMGSASVAKAAATDAAQALMSLSAPAAAAPSARVGAPVRTPFSRCHSNSGTSAAAVAAATEVAALIARGGAPRAAAAAAAAAAADDDDDDDDMGPEVPLSAASGDAVTLPRSQGTREHGSFFPAGVGRSLPADATGFGPWPSLVAPLLRRLAADCDAGFLRSSAALGIAEHAPTRTRDALEAFLSELLGETMVSLQEFAVEQTAPNVFSIHDSRQFSPSMGTLVRAVVWRYIARPRVVASVLAQRGASLARDDVPVPPVPAALCASVSVYDDPVLVAAGISKRRASASAASAAAAATTGTTVEELADAASVAHHEALGEQLAELLCACGQEDPAAFAPAALHAFAVAAVESASGARARATKADEALVAARSVPTRRGKAAAAAAAARGGDDDDDDDDDDGEVPLGVQPAAAWRFGAYSVRCANGPVPVATLAHWFAAGVVQPVVRLIMTLFNAPAVCAPPPVSDTMVCSAATARTFAVQRPVWEPRWFINLDGAAMSAAGAAMVRTGEKLMKQLNIDPAKDPAAAEQFLAQHLNGPNSSMRLAVMALALCAQLTDAPEELPPPTAVGAVVAAKRRVTHAVPRDAAAEAAAAQAAADERMIAEACGIPAAGDNGDDADSDIIGAKPKRRRKRKAPVAAAATTATKAGGGARTSAATRADRAGLAVRTRWAPVIARYRGAFPTTLGEPQRQICAPHSWPQVQQSVTVDRSVDMDIRNEHDAISWMAWAAYRTSLPSAQLAAHPRIEALQALMRGLGYTSTVSCAPRLEDTVRGLHQCAAALLDTATPAYADEHAQWKRHYDAAVRIRDAICTVRDATGIPASTRAVLVAALCVCARDCHVAPPEAPLSAPNATLKVLRERYQLALTAKSSLARTEKLARLTAEIEAAEGAARAERAQVRVPLTVEEAVAAMPPQHLLYPRRADCADRDPLRFAVVMILEAAGRVTNADMTEVAYRVAYAPRDDAWLRQERAAAAAPVSDAPAAACLALPAAAPPPPSLPLPPMLLVPSPSPPVLSPSPVPVLTPLPCQSPTGALGVPFFASGAPAAAWQPVAIHAAEAAAADAAERSSKLRRVEDAVGSAQAALGSAALSRILMPPPPPRAPRAEPPLEVAKPWLNYATGSMENMWMN